jgi:predicted alpha/beta-fold hydrolase
MPIVKSGFKAPIFLKNGHLQTLIPALFRKTDASIYIRERLTTPDDDFVDIDWVRKGSDKLVIICHGLEGNSHSTSVAGMAKHLSDNGFDVLVLNFRSCSGEMNRQLRFYHSGETGDLGLVVNHVLSLNKYATLSLMGFSLGGNVVLKYIGENGKNISPHIKRAVVFSVPCDLESSAYYMMRSGAKIYLNNFLRSLKNKVRIKNGLMPHKITLDGIDEIKTFHDFDGKYTGPMHGFKDAHDYYTKSSSIHFLENITIPTLIVTALNDPFLPAECYPKEIATKHKYLYLEMPSSGGHVGFFSGNIGGTYWSERRALAFLLNDK